MQKKSKEKSTLYKYDFGLSVAGEDRKYAEELALLLRKESVKVFYDRDEEAELWGQDLYQKFQQIYGKKCRFFIPFVSKNYIEKRWPKHELKQAQARDFKSDVEYILPLRLDDTELPGLNETTAYVDLRIKSIEEVSQLCLTKLVRDSSLRQLFIFLRDNNPDAITMFENRPDTLLIRVAIFKAQSLQCILGRINPQICSGSDHHNILMNGGFGPPGCIASIDAEPHTTFSLRLSEKFYDALNA